MYARQAGFTVPHPLLLLTARNPRAPGIRWLYPFSLQPEIPGHQEYAGYTIVTFFPNPTLKNRRVTPLILYGANPQPYMITMVANQHIYSENGHYTAGKDNLLSR